MREVFGSRIAEGGDGVDALKALHADGRTKRPPLHEQSNSRVGNLRLLLLLNESSPHQMRIRVWLNLVIL